MPVNLGEGAATTLSFRLHHIGVVVDDITRHSLHYARNLGMTPRSVVIEDPIQKVKVQFWGVPGEQTAIELIVPAAADSPVSAALAKGGGLNHLGYEVDDIEAALEAALDNGGICARSLAPAAAFGGRRVVFVFHRCLGLVEYIEALRRDGQNP